MDRRDFFGLAVGSAVVLPSSVMDCDGWLIEWNSFHNYISNNRKYEVWFDNTNEEVDAKEYFERFVKYLQQDKDIEITVSEVRLKRTRY